MKRTVYLHYGICVVLFFLPTCVGFAQAADLAWEKLGTIRPRHAREIAASRWSVGAETMDRDYTVYRNWKRYLGPLGVKKARIQGGWAKTELQEGFYNFSWLDEIVFDMHLQGVEPWMCLCYGNRLYAEGGGERLGAQLPTSEKAFEAWLRWVRATVTRYRHVIDEWEIWNEPNLRRANAAADYAGFLIRTASGIKNIQPHAQVLAMSTAGVDTKFVRHVLEFVKEKNALDLIDQVTYHPYTKNPDTSYKAVSELKRVVQSFSPRITLRQGENGCPSMRRRTKALSNYDWTETSQAKWALRRLLGDLGRDIPSSYFAIMDMKYPDEMNAKGLLRSHPDRTVAYAKPAYYAVQHLASIFDRRLERVKEFTIKSETKRPVAAFAYRHAGTGCHCIAIWFKDKIPSDDNTTTPIDFTCSEVRFRRPVYVDLRTGEVFAVPKGCIRTGEGVNSFREIPVYDSPVVVTDRANLSLHCTAGTKSTISQYGIEWRFKAPVKAGRFITGDWWVVGPVTVTEVTPSLRNNENGSVVNPPAGDAQGYDHRIAGFDFSLQAVFPLVLRPGQSLVSTDSVKTIGERTPDTVKGQYCRGPLRTAVVLTCLEKPPPPDAFRPAYVGTWKEMFTASQLRTDLPELKPPARIPDVSMYERYLERIWLDHQRQWVNRRMHPLENMPDYGREITNIVSTVGLMCLLEDPHQHYRKLRLAFIQKGIDYFGAVKSHNDLWVANGGHNSGRKWPILFAGWMLRYRPMMQVKATFQEDQQTYYADVFHGKKVSQKMPVWRISMNNPNTNHEEIEPGLWKQYGDTKGNNGIKAEGYRKLNGPTWVGQALAARLTGMTENWNHPAFFDYVDRWIREGGGPEKGFVRMMWEQYR